MPLAAVVRSEFNIDWRSKMNIKSLLIGSAAALAVVSGAQAADAVVAAEPEPMEYVRVCDAYGTGFFYIPGTETCLKIGGHLRFEKYYEKAKGAKAYYEWHTRGRIQVEAKNDSEWGTVYSFVRVQGDSYNNTTVTDGAGGNQTRWWYYFGIGGLEFGRHDAPGIKFQGYGGRTDWGGSYGDEWDRQYVSYTASFDSITAFVAIENDLYNGVNYGVDLNGDGLVDSLDQEDVDGGNTYMPDISGGIKGKFGDYEVGAFIGYDESDESVNIRKWVRGDIGMFGFTLIGLYSDSDANSFFHYDGFSGIVGLSANVTDTVSVAKDIQWWDDDSWRVIGNVSWSVAPGFSVLVEATYGDGDSVGNDVRTGMLRIQRSF
jgi:hypothetical protein